MRRPRGPGRAAHPETPQGPRDTLRARPLPQPGRCAPHVSAPWDWLCAPGRPRVLSAGAALGACQDVLSPLRAAGLPGLSGRLRGLSEACVCSGSSESRNVGLAVPGRRLSCAGTLSICSRGCCSCTSEPGARCTLVTRPGSLPGAPPAGLRRAGRARGPSSWPERGASAQPHAESPTDAPFADRPRRERGVLQTLVAVPHGLTAPQA